MLELKLPKEFMENSEIQAEKWSSIPTEYPNWENERSGLLYHTDKCLEASAEVEEKRDDEKGRNLCNSRTACFSC